MRTFARLALVVTLALVSAKAKARNPLQSVFKIKQKFGIWMMHIQFAKEGIRKGMDKYFDGMDLSLLSEREINEKMLEYVLETISIHINEVNIELINADFNVEKDRVDIMWTLKDVPQEKKDVDIRIKTCAELDKHSNILKFEDGNTLHNYVLSDDNNFAISFQL